MIWQLLKKLNLLLPHDPTIPLTRYLTKEIKTDVHAPERKFIAALFIIAIIWNTSNVHQLMNWQTYHGIYPYTEILLGNKKDYITDTCNDKYKSKKH